MDMQQTKTEAEKLRKDGYSISDIIGRLISDGSHDGFERGEYHVALYFPGGLLMVSMHGAAIYHPSGS